MNGYSLRKRYRLQLEEDSTASQVVIDEVEWKPGKTAAIVCDMWDTHWCTSAAKRVDEMAPRMNEVINSIREEGVLIIHAPSDCMAFYADTPQRTQAQQTPHASAAMEFTGRYWNQEREPPFPSDPGECSCDLSEPACPADHYPWTRQIDTIKIAEEDAISDNGQEVFNMLEHRDIEDVIVMGVHTNACVLGRPFGIRQLVYLGRKPLLCRDLTDSFHRYEMDHFEGTDLVVQHIETHWCSTITSDQLVGGKAFKFSDDKRDISG